jgi:hypothetical protein
MSTKLQIISNARVMLGDTPVFDLTDEPEQERLFDSLYENMLQLKLWKFALKRIELSRDTEKPVFGYDYQFSLPKDFVRITRFDELNYPTRYELNGRKLLTNNKKIKIEYLSDNAKIEDCPPTVVTYLELQTASVLAISITESPAIAQSFLVQASMQLKRAASIDAMNERNKKIWISAFNNARM